MISQMHVTLVNSYSAQISIWTLGIGLIHLVVKGQDHRDITTIFWYCAIVIFTD